MVDSDRFVVAVRRMNSRLRNVGAKPSAERIDLSPLETTLSSRRFAGPLITNPRLLKIIQGGAEVPYAYEFGVP